MIAAENAALPGGKVGGMADVLRDLPAALADLGHDVQVVTPGYGFLSRLPYSECVGDVEVPFRDGLETVQLYSATPPELSTGQRIWLLEHPLFVGTERGQIYAADPHDSPFSTDANKYALFCAAVAEIMQQKLIDPVDIVHLHDWHAAIWVVLARLIPRYAGLSRVRTVFSIHNIAYQGLRPMSDNDSSLLSWFPSIDTRHEALRDRRIDACFNPMRAAIVLSDAVNTVSPSYASEILRPSDPEHGFYGGEGLEIELADANVQGILNACTYDHNTQVPVSNEQLSAEISKALLRWLAAETTAKSSHVIALNRLNAWKDRVESERPFLMTSVGRISSQKLQILMHRSHPGGRSTLEQILAQPQCYLILLGSGESALEDQLLDMAGSFDNLLFLNGYSDVLADLLYRTGDLFLMPSSFEPCGISQMLSMRDGQPALVHAVGGLSDSVENGLNGFSFSGDDLSAQADAMRETLMRAKALWCNDKEQWLAICEAAKNSRFLWADSAHAYVDLLYRH